MKKTKFLIFVAVLFVAIFVVLMINKNITEESPMEEFLLEDILSEVNLASNESFDEVIDTEITLYVPLSFSGNEDFLFAIDKDNEKEYFIVCRNLKDEQKSELEEFYSKNVLEENVIFYSDEKYLYVVKSEEYSPMIEGIIQSFINNHKSK